MPLVCVLISLFVRQAVVKTADPAIVEPLLNALRSFHLEVQYEGESDFIHRVS